MHMLKLSELTIFHYSLFIIHNCNTLNFPTLNYKTDSKL